MADEPELRAGDANDWVRYLQQLLDHVGQGAGTTDGSFGASTEAALRTFQQAQGLPVTGVADAATWAALTGTASGTAGGTTGAGGSGGGGDVPPEVVALGAPARLADWTPEQRRGYFVGKEPTVQVGGDTPEAVEVLAINLGDTEGGESVA